MPTTALMIGWRPPAITALRRYDVEVTCVLNAAENADRTTILDDDHAIVVEDATNVESVLGGLHRCGLTVADFDLVCSQHEYTLVCAAALGGSRNTITTGLAIALRDKAVQKKLLGSAGIPVAASTTIIDPTALADFPHPRGVLKPLAGSGTKGVRAWHDPSERNRIAEECARAGETGPWLIEEWIDGVEIHIDGVVRDGEIAFVSLGRYLHNVLAVRDGELVATAVQHPELNEELYARGRDTAARTAKALGHHDGVFHLEVFDNGTELVVGEYGGRTPGGSFDEMIRLQHGVDLNEEWARATLGLDHSVAPSVAPTWFGDVFLTTGAGTLRSCPDEALVTRREGVRHAAIRARPGDVRPDPTLASNSFAGSAVVEGSSERQTTERIRELAAWFNAESVLTPAP